MEKNSITNDPALITSELHALCSTVPVTVEQTQASLAAQYYECLAEKTLGPKWEGVHLIKKPSNCWRRLKKN